MKKGPGTAGRPVSNDAEGGVFARAARTLALDAGTVEIVKALHERGTPALLLKGPVTRRWLYQSGEARHYVDVDLLVPAHRADAARETLGRLGFRPANLRRDHEPDEGVPWRRARDGVAVDLHTMLWGVTAGPEELWRVFSEGAETMRIAGFDVPIPRTAVRTWLVAAHAAKHGRNVHKPVEDLRRALDQVDEATWREAAEIASELGGIEPFAGGLRLTAEGSRRANELGLPVPVDAGVTLSAEAPSRGMPRFDAFVARRGFRRKALFLLERLAPTVTFMRTIYPLARRGFWGLAAAYVVRPFDVGWRTLRGLRPWMIARKRERAARK